MKISVETEVTEYYNCPPSKNTINIFEIQDKALTIKCCDDKLKVLFETEISIDDANEIASLILNQK